MSPGLAVTTVMSGGQVMDCSFFATPDTETTADGVSGSLLAIVRVAVLAPVVVGVKRAWNVKQASGAMVTGNPPAGAATVNCESEEVIEFTLRSAAPMLQTMKFWTLVVPTQVSANVRLLGA